MFHKCVIPLSQYMKPETHILIQKYERIMKNKCVENQVLCLQRTHTRAPKSECSGVLVKHWRKMRSFPGFCGQLKRVILIPGIRECYLVRQHMDSHSKVGLTPFWNKQSLFSSFRSVYSSKNDPRDPKVAESELPLFGLLLELLTDDFSL